jgi:hypothetical protein
MTPQEFIEKWQKSELKERFASQSHFNGLLLEEQFLAATYCWGDYMPDMPDEFFVQLSELNQLRAGKQE